MTSEFLIAAAFLYVIIESPGRSLVIFRHVRLDVTKQALESGIYAPRPWNWYILFGYKLKVVLETYLKYCRWC